MLSNHRQIIICFLFLSAAFGSSLSVVHFFGVDIYLFRCFLMGIACCLFAGRYTIPVEQKGFFNLLMFWLLYSVLQVAAQLLFQFDVISSPSYLINILFVSFSIFVYSYLFSDLSEIAVVKIAKGLVIMSAIIAIMAVYEIVTHRYFFARVGAVPALSVIEQHHQALALVGFSNPNDLSSFLVLPAIFCVYLVIVSRTFFQRLMFILLACFFAALSAYNGGRVSVIVFVLSLIYLLWLTQFNVKSLLFLLLGVAFVFFLFYSGGGKYFGHILNKLSILYSTFHSSEPLNGVGSISQRIGLYIQAIYFLFTSYGLGIGAGSFEQYMLHINHTYAPFSPPNPHSFYFALLAEGGLFIFLGFMFLLKRVVYGIGDKSLAIRYLIGSLLLWNTLGSFESSRTVKSSIFWFAFAFMYYLATYKQTKTNIKSSNLT